MTQNETGKMFKDELKNYVNNNSKLVSMKPVGEDMFILKYKKKVFYDNLWNRFLEECRGTIVDSEFNVVTRPFTKIYNFRVEKKAPSLPDDTVVTAYRKVNGFMVAVTWHNSKLLVSTTGSTDSPFVELAKSKMDLDRYAEVCKNWSHVTFMFECVHEEDPHIVPEEAGMYLLGYREKSWDSKVSKIEVDPGLLYALSKQFECQVPEFRQMTIGSLMRALKFVKHEGFVFYTDDGVAAKVKSPHYLVSKFVARNPRTDKLMKPDVKKFVDEEYYDLIDYIQANIEEFTAMDEQTRLDWVRKYLEG